MAKQPQKYVLVQHSAFGYSRDRTFEGGLETRTVSNPDKIKKLEERGAALYDDYSAADKAAHDFMYPESVKGLVPNALLTGGFSHMVVDGLRVFVPNKKA